MQANFKKHILQFKQPGGTSRGVLHTKETWLLEIQEGYRYGIGECGLFRGLSADDRPDYEEKLQWVCENIRLGEAFLLKEAAKFPSIQMGIESAFKSFSSENPDILFPSDFTEGKVGIPTNGLIWMGSAEYMKEQIKEKLEQGFSCLKLKIGAIDFDTEIGLLHEIRQQFSANEVALRVDANGAFSVDEALEKLKRLSDFDLHSIEQPIRARQWEAMADLCKKTPLPIALDEELIGIYDITKKRELLQTISPQYIILKPSLMGGFTGSDEWIALAEKQGCGWWITSALESNIGLNAIAQYTFTKNVSLPQGLGTGGLFTNNFPSSLEMRRERLWFNYSKL